MGRLRLALSLSLSVALSACVVNERAPQPLPPLPAEDQVAPLSALVDEVDIPYDTFTLANGLQVIVHTDRKAPVIGVTTYYRVGSKAEPRGKTGFAHLFEHLMFTGSENVDNFDIPLEGAGSTGTNGSTNADRTNYVETVPTGALDLALMMESDRMGHLLGSVDQDKLDKQRAVVQNEKRQGDNQPYGLTRYLFDEIFPVGHPYRHSTIGSMADLDAATLPDVREWFRDNYAPNNVVLALTGDIDVATAKAAVERWYGDIPAGPKVDIRPAGPVTLPAPIDRVVADQVPLPRAFRLWSGPGLNDADAAALTVGMYVLGGLASSRLDNELVRGKEEAVQVTASYEPSEQVGLLYAMMDVKPGVDRATAEATFDTLLADYIATGPTEDEIRRAATQIISQQIDGLEQVGDFGGKGMTLAEGLLYSGDAGQYRKDLANIAAVTPEQVRTALAKWLGRPVYKLAVVPGTRVLDGATLGGWGDEATTPAPAPDAKLPVAPVAKSAPREYPPVGPAKPLEFPAVERARLMNGIPVALAHRDAIPKISMVLEFDAGNAADRPAQAGTQSLMMDLLEEGTTTRSAIDIAEEEERLGASIDVGTSRDASVLSMTALSANLAPSLGLLADIARNPAFAPDDVARVKAQRLADIQQNLSNPRALASMALNPLIYGADHPYGAPSSLGTTATIAALDGAALSAAHSTWLRPSTARITVVGDVTMAELLPQLEGAFGNWRDNRMAVPTKAVTTAAPAAQPRLVVIDRPNSPSSVLMFGRALPLTGTTAAQEALSLANEVIGNGFLSRLNMDLREDKGWTYGIRSAVSADVGTSTATVSTLVQADRTADSIRLILDDMKAFPKTRGIDEVELQRVIEGNILNLPTRYQTNDQVLGALVANQRLGRPDDYQAQLPALYGALDAKAIDAAAAQYLQPDDMVIVVVGDRTVIDPQLKTLDMPIEYKDAKDL